MRDVCQRRSKSEIEREKAPMGALKWARLRGDTLNICLPINGIKRMD